MILLFFALIPGLLWDEGPQSATVLEKAGIRQIVTTGDAGAWSGTKVHATSVDASTLLRLDPPGVDYQIGRAGATAAPWVRSNLWRELENRGKSFLYDVAGPAVPLAVAEAYASGAPAYLKVKEQDLGAFASTVQFLRQMDGPTLPPRANFGLVNDGSPELEEVMNLLIRRNLLFEPIHSASEWKGTVVRIGSPEYPKDSAADPYAFAALTRRNIGDDHRLVRIYGSETTIARLYGDERRERLHLLQYSGMPTQGVRVRVLGRYPRVLIAIPGQRMVVPEDVSVSSTATEFSIPEIRTYAIIDLDGSAPGTLSSTYSKNDFALTADPKAQQWRAVRPVKIETNAFGGPLPFAATEIRSRWTLDSLYLLYVCPFQSLSLKPDPVTDRDTPALWNWDVAEAFIGGDAKNIGQYREYQVSPQGEWVDLDIDVLHPKAEGGIGWNSGFAVKARIDEAAKVWYGEMRIPLTSIAAQEFKSGDRLRLGLFRITGTGEEHTLVAWQPSFRRSFHVPEAFGTLVLEGAGPR